MFNIDNWKAHIYKKDLIGVLVNGLLVAIFVGMLAGAIDYLFDIINFSMSLGLLLLCYAVGYRVRRGYFNFHIIYSILAVIFMLIGLFIELLTYYCFIYGSITRLPNILSSWTFYRNYLIFPVYYFYLLTIDFRIIYVFLGIIDFIFFIISIVICFRLSGGKIK